MLRLDKKIIYLDTFEFVKRYRYIIRIQRSDLTLTLI